MGRGQEQTRWIGPASAQLFAERIRHLFLREKWQDDEGEGTAMGYRGRSDNPWRFVPLGKEKEVTLAYRNILTGTIK